MYMDMIRQLEEFLKKKKIRKDQCMILILVGVLLCVTALPVKKEEDSSTKSDLKYRQSDSVSIPTDSAADMEGGNAACKEETLVSAWEQKLSETLSCIEGAGDVRVMITLQESEGKIVEKDGTEKSAETAETDSQGGNRNIQELLEEKSTVFTETESGESVPFVVRTTAPVVKGVVVLAQGAENPAVKQEIIASVQVLFHLDANKIRVVKMKNINQ